MIRIGRYKSLSRWFCGALLLLLSHLAIAAGELKIEVVDAVSQRPINTVQLTIQYKNGNSFEITTGANGEAELKNLQTGLYQLLVTKEKYLSVRLNSIRINEEKTTALLIELKPAKNNIEEVLVLGTTSAVDGLGSAGSSVIDREALRSAAGSGSDVLRALDGLPGLFSSGDFASFTVRGNGPRDNLILVDGIPFANVVHFNESFGSQEDVEGGGRYSVFAPNVINKAQFQPGGWSAAYGGRAGSLLQLEVAAGNPESPSYTTRLDVAGVEIGYDGPSGFDEQTSVLFSARQLDFGRLFETIGIEEIGTPELTDVIFKSRSEIDDKNKLEVLVIYAPESFSRTVDNVLASDEDNPGVYEDIELVESERDNTLLGIKWQRLFGADGQLTNQLYLREYEENTFSGEAIVDGLGPEARAEDLVLRENILFSFRSEEEIGLRTDFSFGNSLGRFNSGFRLTQQELDLQLRLNEDWNQYIFESKDRPTDPTRNFITLTFDVVNNNYTEKVNNYVVYVDQEFQYSHWDMKLGLRAERDGYVDENLIAPRFALDFGLSEKISLTANLGRYFQSPLLDIRASNSQNAGLENEVIDQFSLGIKYFFSSDIEFFIEPYFQSLDKRIVEVDGVSQRFENLGEGRSFGFDTALTRRFSDSWSASFTYSYNDSQVKDSSDAEYYEAEFSRPHSMSLGGVWEISERWKISGRWKLASGALRDEFVIYEDVLPEGQPLRYSKEIIAQNSDRYKAYHSLNFRADYRQRFGRVNLIAFIDVINLYGAANQSNSEFNERNGEDLTEEGETFPLFGLRFEW